MTISLTPKPKYNPNFIGREEELKAIHQKFVEQESKQKCRLIMLTGEAGIGKTGLAVKYFYTFMHEYETVAWISVEGTFKVSILKGLESFMKNFEAKNLNDFNKVLWVLGNIEGKSLLVLDGINNLKDLIRDSTDLRRLSNFHTLVTTRIREFDLIYFHPINGLPYEQALQLFKKYYPKHKAQEEEIFRAIYTAVGQNTLIIELLAKNLQLLNRLNERYPLNNLLQDLQNKGVLGLSQSRPVQTNYIIQRPLQLITALPETIIADMYDLGELSEQEKNTLRLLAMQPPEALPFEKIEAMPQKNNFTDIDDFTNIGETLLNLAQKGWIIYNENEITFKLSPVVWSILTN